MYDRKEMKKQAKRSLKKHYRIFFLLCVIAAFIGVKYSNALIFLRTPIGIAQAERAGEDREGAFTVSAGLLNMGDSAFVTNMLEDLIAEVRGDGDVPDGETEDSGTEEAATEGVLASVINVVSSGTLMLTLVSGVASIIGSKGAAMVIVILLGILLVSAIWTFGVNIYAAVSARVFLEGRVYDDVSKGRSLFFLKVKRWTRVSMIMLVKTLYLTLWGLTVVGWVIKTYSYRMVPYIAAENPSISPREAITLSRKMMHGHKWECFRLDLSFIGWHLLSLVTLGTSGLFFSIPYIEATLSEYYACLRQTAKERDPEGFALLNDRYLFELPAGEEILRAYEKELAIAEEPLPQVKERTGVGGFFERVFGVVLFPDGQEQAYNACMVRREKIRSLQSELALKAYPTKLCPTPEAEKREKVRNLYASRHYSVWSLILMFFCFGMFGWAWEVLYHLVTVGEFVNRGVLHGPWLPIYGAGGLLILLLLNKFRRKPIVEFLLTLVLCGVVEYFTGWVLELLHDGQRWWDYSDYFLNLHGRICAEGLLLFGLGGMLVVYMVAPMLDNAIRKISPKVLIPLCMALVAVFCVDEIYSVKRPNTGKGVTAGFVQAEDAGIEKMQNGFGTLPAVYGVLPCDPAETQ